MYTQSQHNSNSECSATTNEPKIQSTQLLFFSLHGPEFLNWTQKQENSNRFCATGGIRTLNTDCGQIGRTVEPNTVRPRRERRSVSEQVVGSRVGSRPGPPTKRKPQVFVREGSCSTKPTHCSLDPPPPALDPPLDTKRHRPVQMQLWDGSQNLFNLPVCRRRKFQLSHHSICVEFA